MSSKHEMDKIEARLFATYFQDGMWDVMIGWMLIVTGVRSFIDHWSISFLIFAGVILAVFIRKYVTVRRLGYAKFGNERRRKRKKILILVIGANLLTLLILLVTILGIGSAPGIFGLVIALTVLIIFSAVAYMMNYPRFALWGILFSGCILVTEIAGSDPGKYFFLVIGTAVLITGIIYFMSFLRKYPAVTGG
ncbi:MAG: hypothetical protein ACMUIG_00490 [Thermoplasmatota archaeon]